MERHREAREASVELVRFRLEEKQQELEKLQRLLEEKGLFAGDLAEQRRRCQMVLSQLDAGMLLLEEKGHNMVTRLSELRQTIHQNEKRLAENREQLEKASVEQIEASSALETVSAQVDEVRAKMEQTRKERKRLDGEIGRLNGLVRNRAKQADDATLAILKATESLSTADVEDDLLKRRAQQIESSFAATQTTLAARRGRIEEIEAQLAKLQRESALAKSDIDKRVRLLDDARKALVAKRDELNQLKAELKGLEEVDRAFDAASPLLSWVMEREDDVEGIVAQLSEVLTAPGELEALVELLLGGDLFGLAMRDAKCTADLVNHIIASDVEGGELSLVPAVGSVGSRKPAAFGEHLVDMLEFDEGNARVADALLGDVYLVDTVEAAIEASQADETGARFATREGVVAWPSGKVTYGRRTADAEGVLARKRRMNALRDAQPEAELAVADAEALAERAQERLQVAQADDFELSQSIAQLSGECDSLREEAGRLEASITGLMQEKGEIEERRKKVAAQTEKTRKQVGELEEKKAACEQERSSFEEELGKVRDERRRFFEDETVSSNRVQQLQVELATVRERERHLRSTVDSATRVISQLDESLEVSCQTERNLELLRQRVQPLYGTLTELRGFVTEKAEALRDRAQLEQAGQGDLRNTIDMVKNTVVERQKQVDEASEGLVQIRIEKSKLEVRVEQAIKAITEESGVLLEIALELPAPQDRHEMEQQRERLSRRIKNLGSVNPVAVDEYRKLKERRDFIAIQVDDLQSAAKALERIVAAIDRKMRNRFMETYNEVNANFQEIIASLFPGGQGYLELTDPESPETTGVEVHAQPRGKTVRKQSLLSGGEQSLVSLALMFAVYRVRSTPFYILDEVEAALDDTNLRRLLSYLDSIRGTTQIIMISHQRRTMEMADLLYGVSMRSDGVSKLVSQKLDQVIRNVSGTRDVDSFTGAK